MSHLRLVPHTFTGSVGRRHFRARVVPSKKDKKKCGKCGRPVRRSWRTLLTWSNCFRCRYWIMIYGDSITVKYVEA